MQQVTEDVEDVPQMYLRAVFDLSAPLYFRPTNSLFMGSG